MINHEPNCPNNANSAYPNDKCVCKFKKFNELETLAKPLQDWMMDNFSMICKVEIDSDGVRVWSVEMGSPIASIFETLKHIITGQAEINEAEITQESSFYGDLDMCGSDIANLAFVAEKEFKIEISLDEWYGLKTVGEVVKYIEGKV